MSGPPLDDGEPDLDERHEVGCWSHCRRKAREAAITSKDPVAREAVLRIKRIFDLDRSWRGKPPDEIRSLHELHLRDLFRVLPHWPRDPYLELAPRYWLATRTRLDAAQLERELGPLIIPGPPPSEQPPAR